MTRRPVPAVRDLVHYEVLGGYPLCDTPARGAYVVESLEYVTCPRCRALAPRFEPPPESSRPTVRA